jgi:hypothetical protein
MFELSNISIEHIIVTTLLISQLAWPWGWLGPRDGQDAS